MDGYLAKPIRLELLQKEIARVTNHDKKGNEASDQPRNASTEKEWNLTELLGRLDDDRAFFRDLLLVFREDSQINLQKAKTALAEGDLAELARAAHTLKGMLKNLFMNRAAETAADLENASRHGKRNDVELLFKELERALADLLPEVDAQLAEVKA